MTMIRRCARCPLSSPPTDRGRCRSPRARLQIITDIIIIIISSSSSSVISINKYV